MNHPDIIKNTFSCFTEIEPIKIGGQKSVFRAIHCDLGNVVLKLINPFQELDRIVREISLVKENAFPRVPVIYEYGNKSIGNIDTLYIFEQLIDGSDLREHLNRRKTFNIHQLLDFLDSLIRIVIELEKKKIVHRDIKPENILLDSIGQYWLVDFGIARALNDVSLTATSASFGPHTLGYAAPEQLRNQKKQIDSRADLFSIGVVAYEMFSGINPFSCDATSAVDIILRTETERESLLAIPGDSENSLAVFIQTLMAKSPLWRPPTAIIAYDWLMDIKQKIKEG